ncbi:DNA mismatch repair endonuclease MutL [Pantoea sp. Mhis]|uniref:DNA mismatch repair endonuclease MutL n=1 Tax=Pantoea sp. Mhis TaxID=2576759 RepID=UPI00135C6A80|nr:DNA mismatch repair endonuclease MutL [Pantoea sp. Mhis]MXP56378.1 DNA mismatch repair endonuclease MutL [Pantoea sp. Mhis]
MAIKTLPLHLIRQIAAGELVERPSGVVKELLENSLDANSSRIDVVIENGGMELIRVRDNGDGISKTDLTLALSHHATSKISSLDDLESIITFGFRGEALASISSVSKLILTSRTVNQNQAWQGYTEGNTSEIKLKPAAHPIGTSLEVMDLFYNKPARRKFMRTEKTEFTHIDEVIRRIALSRSDVTFSIEHNGKFIRQYKAITNNLKDEYRVSTICGIHFMNNSVRIHCKHDNLFLHGWISIDINSYRSVNFQYCYVNGRVIRDKIINNAVREAYKIFLRYDNKIAYVLHLEIDPDQVDVNVHPAKHEIRFYQSRFVHDFIYQAVINTLKNSALMNSELFFQIPYNDILNKYKNIHNQYEKPINLEHVSQKKIRTKSNDKITRKKKLFDIPQSTLIPSISSSYQINTKIPLFFSKIESFGQILKIIRKNYALLIRDDILQLLSISNAERYLKQVQLYPRKNELKFQQLFIPIKIKVTKQEMIILDKQSVLLNIIGINLQKQDQYVILNKVPFPLRNQNWKILIPALLQYLSNIEQEVSLSSLVQWLSYHDFSEQVHWCDSKVVTLLRELETFCPKLLNSPPSDLIKIIDIDHVINKLNYESSKRR